MTLLMKHFFNFQNMDLSDQNRLMELLYEIVI